MAYQAGAALSGSEWGALCRSPFLVGASREASRVHHLLTVRNSRRRRRYPG
jgi:hypothetical protein